MLKLFNDMKNVSCIISEGTTIHGNITVDGSALIFGQVVGSIESHKSNGIIDIYGKIFGDITCNKLIIRGDIKGDVICFGKVILTSTANIEGNITYKELKVDKGAEFIGKMEKIKEEKIVDDAECKAS